MKFVAINTGATQFNPHGQAHQCHLHAAGCADIGRYGRDQGGLNDIEADTPEDACADFWSDFIAEESMTREDAINETRIFPCCNRKA